MIRKYLSWLNKPVNMPYWILLNIVEFAVFGILWEYRQIRKWYK